MGAHHCPTCGRMIFPGESECAFCQAEVALLGVPCPNCEAMLPIGAGFCENCGFDLASGELVGIPPQEGGSDDRRQKHKPYYGPGLLGLVARAVYALLDDSGPSSARVRGLRHMGLGFLVLLAWIAIISAVGYLVFDVIRPAQAQAQAQAPAGQPARDAPPPGFVWILFLTIFPAAWSTLKIVLGAFQFVTGVPFANFQQWFESLPIWAILLLTPILVVVVALSVVGLLVGSLAACGYLFRLVAR